MITLRPAAARGHANHGWLDSRHTFSFAGYHDREHMGFGPLRVINEDRVAADRGFGSHPHRDMEIISYVVDGALAHRDSMGTGSVIHPGEVQLMSAGAGVVHSEMNPSPSEPVHFLQIWIQPAVRGEASGYQQRDFGAATGLALVVSPDGQDGSLVIQQDARVYRGRFDTETTVSHAVGPGRRAWIQQVRGAATVDGVVLTAGDGAAITDTPQFTLAAAAGSELLLFDLP